MPAYCGLECETCPIHLATLEPDAGERRRRRAEIARICNDVYGLALGADEITECDGCSCEGGALFSGCRKCRIRACARTRRLSTCALCPDYVCKILNEHFEKDPGARARLDAIRGAQ